MNWLISTFYARSRPVRILLVAGLLLFVSAVPVGLAVYQFFLSLGNIYREQDARTFPQEVMAYRHPHLASCPRILPFFDACRRLDPIVASASPLDATTFAGLSPDQRELVETSLRVIASQTWEDLLTFSIKSSNQQDQLNLTRFAQRARFIASYTLLARTTDPGYDLMPAAKAMERHNVFAELCNPTLIGKMVGLGGSWLTDCCWHQLLSRKAVTAQEAHALLSIADQGNRLRFSLAETLHFEYVYVERLYFQLHTRAPLGARLLETVFGDPLAAFRELQGRLDTLTPEDIGNGFDLRRPIYLQFVVPNVAHIRGSVRRREAQHAITGQALARCAGLERVFTDPWKTPLYEKATDSRTIFYSAGPNRTDDGLAGDDIAFDSQRE